METDVVDMYGACISCVHPRFVAEVFGSRVGYLICYHKKATHNKKQLQQLVGMLHFLSLPLKVGLFCCEEKNRFFAAKKPEDAS